MRDVNVSLARSSWSLFRPGGGGVEGHLAVGFGQVLPPSSALSSGSPVTSKGFPERLPRGTQEASGAGQSEPQVI